MTKPTHYWIVERDPFEGDALLAAYGDHPGYFLQNESGSVRKPSAEFGRSIIKRHGPAPRRALPTPNTHAKGGTLIKKAAAARPYEKRTSSANARQYDF